MIKYVDNAFHALKVGFANEIGAVCKALGLDSHVVMDDLLPRHQAQHLAGCYLKPGFAFGGSCLPKDLRAITHRARRADTPVPILESILPSNENQIDRVFRAIEETGQRRVGLLRPVVQGRRPTTCARAPWSRWPRSCSAAGSS